MRGKALFPCGIYPKFTPDPKGLPPQHVAMDPQEWETQALDNLEAWAERTGTDTSSKTYQHRLKSITMKAQADMRAQAVEASGRAGAPDKKSSKVNFDPIKKWGHVAKMKAANLTAAKALLLKVQKGEWKQDVGCPRTGATGGGVAYRFVNVVATGGPHLARVVDLNKNNEWALEVPYFKESESDSEEPKTADAAADETAQEEAAPAEAPPPAPDRKSGRKRKKGH